MVEKTPGAQIGPNEPVGTNSSSESAASSLAKGLSSAPQVQDPAATTPDSDWLRSPELGERGRARIPQVEALDQLRESLGDEGAPKVQQGFVQRIGDILTGSSGRLREKVGLEAQPPAPPEPVGPVTLWERLWGPKATPLEAQPSWSPPSLPRLFASHQFFDLMQSNAWQTLTTAQLDLLQLNQRLRTQGALEQLESLGHDLQVLHTLPTSFKAMGQLSQISSLLKDLPRQMQGLEQLQTLLQDPARSQGVKAVVEQLQGLGQLAREAPQLPHQFQELGRAVGSLQQLGLVGQELHRLPAQFEELSQALPARPEGALTRQPTQSAAELDPFVSTPIPPPALALSQSLQRSPVLARQFGDLSRFQGQLQRSLADLQQALAPGALLPLEKLSREPESVKLGIERLQALASSDEERSDLERLKGLLQPALQGQTVAALKSLAQGAGREQLLALQGQKLDAPAGLEVAVGLSNPQSMASMEKVANGIAEAHEIQRSTVAQQNHMDSLPEVPDFGDLGESLARILEEAQATHRPRSLFGIPLGGARPASGRAPGTPAPMQAAAPSPKLPQESLSKARLDAYRQTYQLVAEQLISRGGKDHPWVLVYHARDAESAKGLADTLESTVVKGGSSKMQSWLGAMTQSADSALALSAVLDHVAQVVPDRMMGILLLTSDGEGGKEALCKAFQAMAGSLDSSLRLADFLETSSRHPMAARGVAELLDALTEPEGEDWSGAEKMAEVFRGMSETVGGARRLNRLLENLGELDGGNRLVSRTLNRMTRTPEGAQALLETLQNLAHDKEGASALGRLLARSSESREGGRDLLTGLQRMLAKPRGQHEVASLLVSLAEGGQGARLLANWTNDLTNAAHLAQIFEQLGQNEGSRVLLGYALQQMSRQRSAFGDFASRVTKSEALAALVDQMPGDLHEPEPSLTDKRGRFRPADVYSRETLRQARICGECGGRTSLLGWCSRCGSA